MQTAPFKKRTRRTLEKVSDDLEDAKLLIFDKKEDYPQAYGRTFDYARKSQITLRINDNRHSNVADPDICLPEVPVDNDSPLAKILRKRAYRSRRGRVPVSTTSIAPLGLPIVPEPSIQFLHGDDIDKLAKVIPNVDPARENPRSVLYKARLYIEALQKEIFKMREKAILNSLEVRRVYPVHGVSLPPLRNLPKN